MAVLYYAGLWPPIALDDDADETIDDAIGSEAIEDGGTGEGGDDVA